MLVPGPDLLAGRDELLGPFHLEGRTDPDRVPLPAQKDAEDALAQPPADLGEIEKVRPAADEQGVEPLLGEQAPGVFAARREILRCQRCDARGDVLELLAGPGSGRGGSARIEAQGGEGYGPGLDERTARQ